MDSHVELGWDPLDLTDEEVHIADLLKDCSWVDHSVPAVTHMRGGSQVRSAHEAVCTRICLPTGGVPSADPRCPLRGQNLRHRGNKLLADGHVVCAVRLRAHSSHLKM